MNTLRWCEYCGTTEVKTIPPFSTHESPTQNEQHTSQQSPQLEDRLKACNGCQLVYYCSEAHKEAHQEKHDELCKQYQHYKATGEKPEAKGKVAAKEEENKQQSQQQGIKEEEKASEGVDKKPGITGITLNNHLTFQFEDDESINKYGQPMLVDTIRKVAADVDVLVHLKQYRLASRELKTMLERWQAKELFPALAPEFEEEAKRMEAHERAAKEANEQSFIARHLRTIAQSNNSNSTNKKKKKKKKQHKKKQAAAANQHAGTHQQDKANAEEIAKIQQVRTMNTGTICFAIAANHWKLYEQSIVNKTMEYYNMVNEMQQAKNNDEAAKQEKMMKEFQEMQRLQRYKKHPWHKDQEEAMNFAMDGAKMNPSKTPIDLCLAICKPLKKEKQTMGMIGILEPMYEKLQHMMKVHQEAVQKKERLLNSGDVHIDMKIQGSLTASVEEDQETILKHITTRTKECHRYLFEAYFQCGKLEKSQAQADALLAIQADSAVGYAQQGKIQVELAKTEKAEGLYRKAIELEPTYAEAHLQLAQILANNPDKVNEAIDHCEKCLELNKEDQDVLQPAYLLLATIYIAKNELNKAGVTLMRGLAQFPHSGILLMHIGIFLVQNRKYKQGIHYLTKSLQPGSGLETWLSYIYILKHLTIAYIKEGLFRDAEESLCQILHKDQYNEFGCFFLDHLRAYLNTLKIHLPHVTQASNYSKHQITAILHILNEKKHEFYLSHILESYLNVYPLTSGQQKTPHGVTLNSKIEFYENMNVHEEWTEIFWTDYAIRLSTDAILTYNLMKKWHKLDEHSLEDDEPPANLEELENHISSKIKLGRTVMPIIEMGREYIDVAKKLKMSIVSGPHPPACVDSAFWCIPLLNLPMYCIVCGEVEGIHGNLTPCATCESVYFCSDQCYDIDAKQHCHHCKRSNHKMTSHTIQNYRSFLEKIQREKKDFIESYTTDCFGINGRGAVVVDKTTFTQYPTDRITAVRYYTLKEVSKFAVSPKQLKQALKLIETYNPKKQYVAIYNYGGMFQCELMQYPSHLASQTRHDSTISHKKEKIMKALIHSDEHQKKKKRKNKKKFQKPATTDVVEEGVVELTQEEGKPIVEAHGKKSSKRNSPTKQDRLEEQQILDGLLLDFADKIDEKVVRLVFEQSKSKDYKVVSNMLASMINVPHKQRQKKKHYPKKINNKSKKKGRKEKRFSKKNPPSPTTTTTKSEPVQVRMTWGEVDVVLSKKKASTLPKKIKNEKVEKETVDPAKEPEKVEETMEETIEKEIEEKEELPEEPVEESTEEPAEESTEVDDHSALSTSSDEYQDAVEIDDSHPSPFEYTSLPEKSATDTSPPQQHQFRPMYSWPMVRPNGMVPMANGEFQPHPYNKQYPMPPMQMILAQQAYYYQLQQQNQTPICIYFNTPGGCMRGETCKFRHIRLPVFPPSNNKETKAASKVQE